VLDSGFAEAHAARARILAQLGRVDEALTEIEADLRLDPESYEVNRSAAYLSLREHRLDDAIRYYEKAMSLMDADPHSVSMPIGHIKDLDAALELRPAFERLAIGFLQHAKAYPDLDSIREDPRLKAMVASAEARLAAAGDAVSRTEDPAPTHG
jgi:tetratricopeptide (TPR) repeat protein